MKATIIGSGSFGTALGFVLAEKGEDVVIWTRNPRIKSEINQLHTNETYLPGTRLPENITAALSRREALEDAELVVFVVPTQQLTAVVRDFADLLPPDVPIIVGAKGIERGSLRLVPEIMEQTLPESFHSRLAYLSGPSFALEICRKLPTVVCIASRREDTARRAQQHFAHSFFRVYWSPDVTGVELGGALKNVIAVAAGVADGLGMGHNTRAAIITRGLSEITRLGRAMGADPLTFMGLSGLGDLVLTCTADLSRNRRVGFELGRGKGLDEALAETGLAEGVETAESVYRLSRSKNVEMAICDEVYSLLYEGKDPRRAVRDLMERELKKEDA